MAFRYRRDFPRGDSVLGSCSNHPSFDDTLRRNVAIGKKTKIDDARVFDALKKAQIDAFVRGLPTGWERSSASMERKCRAVNSASVSPGLCITTGCACFR